MSSSELTGRVALVTGGGRGIGRAIAMELGAAGAKILVVSRSADELQSVVAELESCGVEASSLAVDLTRSEAATEAVDLARNRYGKLDILVNNAGIAPSSSFLRTSKEEWDSVMHLNVTVPFLMCQAALPGMLEQGWGRILNVASTAAKVGYPYTSAYTTSKHGLLGLTRALAAETAGKGVTVNALCPGFTDTKLTEESIRRIVEKTGRSAEEARAALESQSPMGKLIRPEEVAKVAVFLAGEESSNIHGQAINIDGGAVTH